MTNVRQILLSGAAIAIALTLGCSRESSNGSGSAGTTSQHTFISIGTAPQGGVFNLFGNTAQGILDANKSEFGWRGVTAETTGGSLENLRLLDSDEIQLGLANSTISYFAVHGEGGFEKKYEVKSIMTLFPLIAMFVTKADSGIDSIAGLKGKRVVVGPEGEGFEYFIRPILEEHGVKFGKDKSDSDFEPVNTGMISSVGQLQDGSVHATFLGGGIKSPAISNADSVMDIHLIPFDADKRAALIERLPSFTAATIPAKTYGGQDELFAGLNVGSAQILVRSDADDQFVYDVTKLLFENLGKMAETIAAVKAVNAGNVSRDTGVEFHPGAIRFYQELAEEAATESTEPPGKEATDEAKSDSGDATK